MRIESLIQLVLDRCEQEGMLRPLKTRLVKLLYLVEVEYYRRKGHRLTNLEWKFYHFGPFAFALVPYLGDPNVDALSIEGQGLLARLEPEIRREARREPDAELAVANIVHEWGDADLNVLLDYVYFETEPMQSARRGDLLDFSSVTPLPATRRMRIELDRKRIGELRRKLAGRAPFYAELRKRTLGSEELFANLREWDSDRTLGLREGECSIDPDDLVPTDEG